MTPSEIIQKAIAEVRDARAKATPGKMQGFLAQSRRGSQIFDKAQIVWSPPDHPEENIVLHQWKIKGQQPSYFKDVFFYAKAANRIEALAQALEVCVEALEAIKITSPITNVEILMQYKAEKALQKAAEILGGGE